MNLPDPVASRAVLIGSYSYRDLEPLPSVANNIERLRDLFTARDLWGLPPENCHVLPNPSSPAEVLDLIHEAALEASDTLVVYYAGHGLVDPHTEDLYLALPASSLTRLYRAVRFEDLRREMVTVATASSKVVILDCCYSGRAMLGGMSGSMEMADQARIEGTYLMTASADTVKAQAPVGEEFTAFTNELVTALALGLPDGPDLLNVETLYWHARKELIAKRRPIPQQRAGNDGGMIVLARNRRGVTFADRPGLSQAPPPEPPEGSELFMRRSPREIVGEATRLSGLDRVTEAEQLLIAVAVRRPDQEVATLISLLRAKHRDSDADLVINAAMQRPAEQIVALLDVLQQIGSAQDADRVLAGVAHRSLTEVGATADTLAKGGRNNELHRLLDSSVRAHRSPEEIIALMGTLSSIGLGDEIGRLLDLAAGGLTDEETAALADVLRAAGRDDAAFRLYATALGSIARRPAKDIASLLHAMRDTARDDEADRLLGEVCAVEPKPHEVAELTLALCSVSLDSDAERLLDTAGATMTDEQVAAIAASLRAADLYEPALHLCVEAAARQPVPVTPAIIRSLRDAGRPLDAQRVLDSTGAWSPARCADLVASLRRAGNDADADWLLADVSRAGADKFCSVMAALRSHGFDEDAGRLARLITLDAPRNVCILASGLVEQGLDSDAEDVLVRAVSSSVEYYCDLIVMLQKANMDQYAEHLLRWKSEQEVSKIRPQLAALRQRGQDDNANQLLAYFASRPITDIIKLVETFSSDDAGAMRHLLASLAQRTPQDIVSAIKAAQQKRGIHIDADLTDIVLADIADGPLEIIVSFAALLHEVLPSVLPEFIRMIILRQRSHVGAIVGSMRHAGLDKPANELLRATVKEMKASDLFTFHMALSKKGQSDDADHLLEIAIVARSPSFLASLIGEFALDSSGHGSEHMRAVLMAIAARYSEDYVGELARELRERGMSSEARLLFRYYRTHKRGPA